MSSCWKMTRIGNRAGSMSAGRCRWPTISTTGIELGPGPVGQVREPQPVAHPDPQAEQQGAGAGGARQRFRRRAEDLDAHALGRLELHDLDLGRDLRVSGGCRRWTRPARCSRGREPGWRRGSGGDGRRTGDSGRSRPWPCANGDHGQGSQPEPRQCAPSPGRRSRSVLVGSWHQSWRKAVGNRFGTTPRRIAGQARVPPGRGSSRDQATGSRSPAPNQKFGPGGGTAPPASGEPGPETGGCGTASAPGGGTGVNGPAPGTTGETGAESTGTLPVTAATRSHGRGRACSAGVASYAGPVDPPFGISRSMPPSRTISRIVPRLSASRIGSTPGSSRVETSVSTPATASSWYFGSGR